LEALLGPEGKRRLRLRHMTNEELFPLYDSDLLLRLHNAKDLSDHRRMLARFRIALQAFPPSVELAKTFLAQYVDRKPRTLARYAKMIGGFMRWYGEALDFKVKVPRTLPPYVEDADVEKLLVAIEKKITHKGTIVRDCLLVEAAQRTGMRRGELSNLEAGDIHSDFLMVRHGKGDKDRMIPLPPALAIRLQNFTKGMEPSEKVFKLKPPCITMKIKKFARLAGLHDLHTHSLRSKYATNLLESGADIRAVQTLLGHENIATTQSYLAITDKRLREAVALLDKRPQAQPKPPEAYQHSWEAPEYLRTLAEQNAEKARELTKNAVVLPAGHPRLSSY
jgi:integrase/recombinase XerD